MTEDVAFYVALAREAEGPLVGLEVESLHGGFAGEPFGDESREYVFVVRRRRGGGPCFRG